jgi:hypothetical protein
MSVKVTQSRFNKRNGMFEETTVETGSATVALQELEEWNKGMKPKEDPLEESWFMNRGFLETRWNSCHVELMRYMMKKYVDMDIPGLLGIEVIIKPWRDSD